MRNDFIELFNRGNTTVDLSGWSVQYAAPTGATWQVTNLSGTLAPGQYYLIRQAAGAGCANNMPCGVDLPAHDATGNIAMSATAGKVALVNQTTALNDGCPVGARLLDLVGYGSTASCFEGSGTAPAPSNTNAVHRKSDGCADTGNNSADFAAGAPAPRNRSSPVKTCAVGAAGISRFFFDYLLRGFREP